MTQPQSSLQENKAHNSSPEAQTGESTESYYDSAWYTNINVPHNFKKLVKVII